MAVTITDNRTTISAANATTGWTSTAGHDTFTAQPSPVEGTACLGMQVSNAQEDAYFTLPASVNMGGTGTLVYQWVFPRGEMATTANGGIQLQLGDGTNRIGFHLAGADIAPFRHDQGPVGWQCMVLDTANLPTSFTVLSGSRVGLNLSAITQVGVVFTTLVKSVGGVENCFWDVSRRGTGGLTITGGSVGDPGKFSEIATLDRSTGAGQGYGIIRQLGEGVFGVQGPLTFGSGATATYFSDQNATLVFEDRNFLDDKYIVTVQGSGTTFQLGLPAGATGGSDGCTLITPSTTSSGWVATDTGTNTLNIYGSTFTGFREGISFSSGANATGHEFYGNTVRLSGQVDMGQVPTRNCTFTGYADTNAALLWNENINIQDCAFEGNVDATNDPAGIEHPSAIGTPYTYIDLTFASNDFDIFNSSGSAITVQAQGTSNPSTSRGSAVAIEKVVTLTLTGLETDSEVRVFRDSDNVEIGGTESSTNTFVLSYNYTSDTDVYIVVHHLNFRYLRLANVTLTSSNAVLPIQQQVDRVYNNP